MDTFDENFGCFRGMETLETILVSQGQIVEAELYNYKDNVNIPRYSVGIIENRRGSQSTAWISSVVSKPYWYRYCGEYYRVIATAITAAHTIYFEENAREYSWNFCVKPEKKDKSNTFKASPFIDFVDSSKSYKDPITGHEFYLPGDVMIFLIFETSGTKVNLKPLKVLNRELIEGDHIVIFGYPDPCSRNSRLGTICPLSINHTSIQRRDILRALREGNKLVRSSGKIMRKGDLICVSCTSVPGMSGSPACIIEEGDYKVVGILVGGPAAPFQRELADIIDCDIRRDWLGAYKKLNHIMQSQYVEHYLEMQKLDAVRIFHSMRQPFTDFLWNLHSNLLPKYVKGGHADEANHNLVLSKTSDSFMLALEISRVLQI